MHVCYDAAGASTWERRGSRKWDSFAVIDVGGRVERLSLFVLES